MDAWWMGVPSESIVIGFLFLAGTLAGFVDSIVGGGGLISVPAMLLTNLPPSIALGSNKLSSIFGAGTASITFLRNGMVDKQLVKKLWPLTFIGALGGTMVVIAMPPLFVKPLIIVLLVGVMIFVVCKKDWGLVNRSTAVRGKTLYIAMLFALCIGVYDGFIGPGTGTFLIMAFVGTGFDFVHASGNAKVLNFVSNLASLLLFFSLGHVNIGYGLAAGVGQILGAYMGSHLAIAKGSSLVRIVFISVTSAMLLKLGYDYLQILW